MIAPASPAFPTLQTGQDWKPLACTAGHPIKWTADEIRKHLHLENRAGANRRRGKSHEKTFRCRFPAVPRHRGQLHGSQQSFPGGSVTRTRPESESCATRTDFFGIRLRVRDF